MKIRYKIAYIFVAASFSLTGCVNWLDQEPMSSITEAEYFKTAEQFQEAANKLHHDVFGFASTYFDSYVDIDLGSDLIATISDQASGTNTAVAKESPEYYVGSYKALRTINQLIQKSETYDGTGIDIPVGQAHFFRAWWHFYLLQRYGGVAIASYVPENGNDEVLVNGPRSSRYKVVEQIISDLDIAISKLKNFTVGTSGNDGHVTVEAACAFKARVCLFEGTWEKYVGTSTDGDGITVGAGSDGYTPTKYTEYLTMAKSESAKFVSGGEYANSFEIWIQDDNKAGYENQSYFYFFNLEGTNSNPYGVDKSSNHEAIYRTIYDWDKQLRRGNKNLSHAKIVNATRKLMDMYLCTDGLPIHKSPLFMGYLGLNTEFENRDARLTASYKQVLKKYWGYSTIEGGAADYSKTPEETALPAGIFIPVLSSYDSNGRGYYGGRKFCFEQNRATYYESADYNHIRLPEMLLTYAEATYELSGSITDAELSNTINKIRERAHIADLTNALVNTNGLDMLEEIRRERAVELVGESQRLNDLCRWGIAEVELARPLYSYYVNYNGTDTELTTTADPTVAGKMIYESSIWADRILQQDEEQSTYSAGVPKVKAGALITQKKADRKFTKKNYLQPIPTAQIDLNAALKQNPDW